ncbi:hypothetical protein OA561_01175 [bacterium]|nr:hypothetical protein [bacterium]
MPDITVVITKPIKGSIQNVVTLENVLAQFCPERIRDVLIKAPIDNAKKHLKMNVADMPEKMKLISLLNIE